ncbi:Putative Conserved serine proline-rich protein [Penicillium brasilianum]|uniref:Putative Conserved serine proline-rich protein n=1 Tax=Penicillium brasilianum TaxID=104259 RepID=A0A0F7TQZ0_PENBI|nr:Putative Conserved serine proline-rich protein [Penicillium brasilianum]
MSKLSKINHAAGIFADMSVDGPPIGTLVAIIDRAKNLPNRKTMGKQNPYCAARLGKEAKKTPTDLRGGQTPRWDHELRFTVHESPDYFKLKVSIFNDDRKTDLIGETWIDLQNLIIPGGSQNDHWHPLQCRGKYAGDVRIEMTYYDTRQQDEAVIVKRKEAAERVQGKSAAAGPSSSGLSGPRSLEKVKRRPLPTDPSGAVPHPPRPSALEQTHSAPPPLQHPQPSRPPMRDHAHTMPAPAPAPVTNPDALPYPSTHAEPSYDAPSYNPPASSMQSRGTYDAPDLYQRDWDNQASAPAPPPALPPAGTMRRTTHEPSYPNDHPQPQYDPRPTATIRSHIDYDQPPRDYRSTSEPPFEADPRGRSLYDRPPQSHDAYSSVTSPQYSANPMTFGHVSTFSPQISGPGDEPAPLQYSRPSSSSGPADEYRYQPRVMKALPAPRSDPYHPEYATMQPRVEDEEEDAPPPPPPVHRSRMAQPPSPVKMPTSQPPSPYTPYSPGYTGNRSPSMPASLVAGYESEEHDRVYEGRTSRKGSTSHMEDEMMIPQPLSASSSSAMISASMPAQAPVPIPVPYEAPIYPLRTSPQPMDDRSSIRSRGGSVGPDTRMVVTRKSVSPRPPPSRGSSIPFSPDSYDSLNPRSSRSINSREPSPAYESLSQARDAAVRAEVEPIRDPDQPIIGDDGREIDPSDHLPTDTWAPEPERKSRKPEVIIRFKHSPRPTSRGNDTSRPAGPPRVGFRTTTETDRPSKKYTPTHVHTREPVDRTPPRADRGHDSYGSYSHNRGYSTPTTAERPRSSRGSVSPSPGSRSPLYDYNTGPPIPSKVPISHGSPGYPVAASHVSTGNPGMDALSRELKTIDIGSVGCSPSRAVRKYAPSRPSVTMGYAS